MNKPLSFKLRPTSLDDFIGQNHLVSKDSVISNMLNNNKLISMILYGPSGVGKTTLSYIIVNTLGVYYEYLNSATDNKKRLTDIIEIAKQYDGIVLIVDEIHRMKRDIQDVLLPYVEQGLITMIGLTTDNPYYAVNKAVRSRCLILELKPLLKEEIKSGIERCMELINSNNKVEMKIDDDAINLIAEMSNGDLRRAYNITEAVTTSSDSNNVISTQNIKDLFLTNDFYIDKNTDGYYDTLSAFQKSIRGSDVDAALHYLARLITAGDLESICRRLVVTAYEDIGLANPEACSRAVIATQAALRVGLPEARIILSHSICELALSPKSNTSYMAIKNAILDITAGHAEDIPNFIKYNPVDKQGKQLLKGNLWSHNYLPDNLKSKRYFIAKENSSDYEKNLAKNYNILLEKKNKK